MSVMHGEPVCKGWGQHSPSGLYVINLETEGVKSNKIKSSLSTSVPVGARQSFYLKSFQADLKLTETLLSLSK